MITASKSRVAAKTASPATAAKKTGTAVKAKPVAAKSKVPAASVKPAATPEKPGPETAGKKIGKPKLVRDSFTMPEVEYQVLRDVKKVCLAGNIGVKKSELLRIGVAMLRTMDVADLKERIAGLAPMKAGRPKKEK